MENKDIGQRVLDTLCDIAFTPSSGAGVGHQVRCLELLARLTGLFDSVGCEEGVTIVEDI